MMNSTNFIPAPQNTASQADASSALPFPMAESESANFDRLMREVERPVVENDSKDNHEWETGADDDGLSGMAMNMPLVEMSVPRDLPRTIESRNEAQKPAGEVTSGERVERKYGGEQNNLRQSDQSEAKSETSDESASSETEPDAEAMTEVSETKEKPDESVSVAEELDLDTVENPLEESEVEPVQEELETAEAEFTESLELEAEIETNEDLPVEAPEGEPEAEAETKLKPAPNQASLQERKLRSTEGKSEHSPSTENNGTKNAPNQPSMLNTANKLSTMQLEGEDFSSATGFDMGDSAPDQFGGANMEFSENRQEIPQPVLNVQSVTATGQSSAPPIFTTASPQMTAMMETIWNRVTTFRARGDSSWTVQIRADDQTRLQLTIKMGATGLEIQTRMQQGDMGRLGAGWGDLQNALSERGVQLHDLETEESQKDSAEAFDLNLFGNLDENASGEPGEHEAEEALAPAGPKPITRPKPRPVPAHDGFEHWA